MQVDDFLIGYDDAVLVTGASGFIGSRVVRMLLDYGFGNIRCLVRSSSNTVRLQAILDGPDKGKVQVFEGNLLSRDDCRTVAENVSLVFHLAAGIEKTFPGCYMNSVVATRNLLDSLVGKRKSQTLCEC